MENYIESLFDDPEKTDDEEIENRIIDVDYLYSDELEAFEYYENPAAFRAMNR